jgi:hypothetical protein
VIAAVYSELCKRGVSDEVAAEFIRVLTERCALKPDMACVALAARYGHEASCVCSCGIVECLVAGLCYPLAFTVICSLFVLC